MIFFYGFYILRAMVIKMDASLSCYLREEFEVLEMAFEVWRIFQNDQEESGAKGDNQEVTREKEALEKMENMIFKSPNLQIGSPPSFVNFRYTWPLLIAA